MKPSDIVNRKVGLNLSRLRAMRGLTVSGLAAAAGMDASHLGKMERGLRGTTSGNYEVLARALSVELAELFSPAPVGASARSQRTKHARKVARPAA